MLSVESPRAASRVPGCGTVWGVCGYDRAILQGGGRQARKAIGCVRADVMKIWVSNPELSALADKQYEEDSGYIKSFNR